MEVIALALIGTWSGVLVPESKGDGMRRLIAMITGFSILLAVCRPVVAAVEDLQAIPERMYALLFPDWQEGAEIQKDAEEWVTERGVSNVEQGISALIAVRYALQTSEIAVTVNTSKDTDGAVVIDDLLVQINEGASVDLSSMEQYLEELLACPCKAEYITVEAGKDEQVP